MVAANEDAMHRQIARLQTGESFSRSQRVPLDHVTSDGLPIVMDSLRNTLKSATFRAQQNMPSQDYSIEVGIWHTRTYDLVVSAIVTRTN